MKTVSRQRGGGITLAVLACTLGVLAACGGSKPEHVPPDARFGHRYNGDAPDRRTRVVITPPDEKASYMRYPVFFDTLFVRPAPFAPEEKSTNQKVPVELLVKGAFSNACSELDELNQERAGHIIDIELLARRPRSEVCALVERPFRFYLRLPGQYAPGNYTVTLNDIDYAFEIGVPTG